MDNVVKKVAVRCGVRGEAEVVQEVKFKVRMVFVVGSEERGDKVEAVVVTRRRR